MSDIHNDVDIDAIEAEQEAAALSAIQNDLKLDDADIDQEEIPVKILRYNISTYGWDTDVDGLVKRLNRKDIIVPEFQRAFIWTNAEKSRFLESLILGLPIPSIFLATDPITKQMSIIDGQQRLLSLQSYYRGDFALTGKSIQDDLRGKYYPQEDKKRKSILSPEDKRSLDNATLHAVVIKQREATEATGGYTDELIQIFRRLNTSGRPLNAQEIRACIFPGSFNDLLGQLNNNESWRALFGAKHSRLKDMEFILRIIALSMDHSEYTSPMPNFLNKFMEKYRLINEKDASHIKQIVEKAIEIIATSLGVGNFRSGTTFLITRFEAVFVAVAKIYESGKTIAPEQLQAGFAAMLEDGNDEKEGTFKYGVAKFVNDKDRVNSRISAALRYIHS